MRIAILGLVLSLALCAPVAAATVTVYPGGRTEVAVPAGQYINVFTEGAGRALVYKQVGYPNSPSTFTLETGGDVQNEEVSFGPYTYATTIRIVNDGPDRVFYSVGASALAIPVSRVMPALTPGAGSVFRIPSRLVQLQPAPAAITVSAGAATLTAANLLTGILTVSHTTGGTATLTLPTGTLLEAAVPYLQIGEGFEWVLINTSAAAADSATIAAGTDHTIVGDAVVISVHSTTGGAITSRGCTSSTWITKKTAANTFVTYRKN